jgi:hypothetical protein
MGFDPFLDPLHRNKLTTGNAMTATPRAAPRLIVAPLLELELLVSGAQDPVRDGPGDAPLEEEPGDLPVEVGKAYGGIAFASWIPSFEPQQVVFELPQHCPGNWYWQIGKRLRELRASKLSCSLDTGTKKS